MISMMVRAKLLATPAITAIVSDRIYMDGLIQSPVFPAISVYKTSDIPDSKIPGEFSSRVQITCWSNPPYSEGLRSPVECEGLATAVKAVFHKPALSKTPYSMTLSGVTYRVVVSSVQGGTRLINPSDWYYIPVDVKMNYKEVP